MERHLKNTVYSFRLKQDQNCASASVLNTCKVLFCLPNLSTQRINGGGVAHHPDFRQTKRVDVEDHARDGLIDRCHCHVAARSQVAPQSRRRHEKATLRW